MGRHKNVANRTEGDIMESSLKVAEEEKLPIENMPLETLRD